MAEKPCAKNNDIIFLFSSVPADRPNYKSGVLNALCYPNGHLLELSYKRSYIADSLLDGRPLKNRKGVIVFVHYSTGGKPSVGDPEDHQFVPVRLVKVVDFSEKEKAAEYLESTRMYVRVQLGDLIFPDEEHNAKIRSLAGRPRPYSGKKPLDLKYMLAAEDPFPVARPLSQRDVWDHLVERVAKAPSLAGCVFLSTGHVHRFPTGKQCALGALGANEKTYELRPNATYELGLRVYDSGYASEATHDIVVRSSSDLLAVSDPFATATGGPTDHSIVLVCKRTIESTLSTLVIDVRARGMEAAAEAGHGSSPPTPLESTSKPRSGVLAARPRYLFSIRPSRPLLWTFVILVAIGALMTSTSTEFFKDLGWQSAASRALVSKMAGAVALAAAAYIAFRKLPSGGPSGG